MPRDLRGAVAAVLNRGPAGRVVGRAQRLTPARPLHDDSGHTWHHDDDILFEVTKHGLARHAPPGYQSDMRAASVISMERARR